jgi:hypothetical protein
MRNGGDLMFRFSHSSTLPLIHNELIFSIKMFVFQGKNLFFLYLHTWYTELQSQFKSYEIFSYTS